MSLIDIRTAIINDLKAAGLGDAVEPHPGRLTVDELKTFVTKGRASIRVGCLGIPQIDDMVLNTDLMVTWAVYIMALDRQGVPRDETALLLTTAIALRVSKNLWGREDLNGPMDIRADNLYSGPLDKRAVALWAVTWRQAWTPAPIDMSTLDDLLTVVTDFDVDQGSENEPILHDTIELEGES